MKENWWILASFAALERAQDMTIKYCGKLPDGEIPWWKLYLKYCDEVGI